jgi:glutaredoxin
MRNTSSATTTTTEPIRVYWMPGCSSCVKVKEFLTGLGVAFEPVNVLNNPAAMAELEKFGIRTVPVVTKGERYTFAQQLSDVAKFVGKDVSFDRLASDELMRRWFYFLALALSLVADIREEDLDYTPVPGRLDRTLRNLSFHIFQIPEAFLQNQQQGLEDLMPLFEALAPSGWGAKEIEAGGRDVDARLHRWWDGLSDKSCNWPSTRTEGTHPTSEFLERSVWHTAQHARQLMAVLEDRKVSLTRKIDPAAYEGLPMPTMLWQ